MDVLWAPWRMEYIKMCEQKKECFFCKYASQNTDKENLVFLRQDGCFCMLNRYPYNTGHVMVAPLGHKVSFEELSQQEMVGLFKLIAKVKTVLDKVISPHGYNIGINIGRVAGAGETHLHIHIVPRWEGDTNFMPVIANTKVIPMRLEQLYEEIIKQI
jgi:ATP adenylyltransferase